MRLITLDIPLLVVGLVALAWLRLRKPGYRFQVACQFFGTFWAQYSFIVSWSLARLVPFISASTFTAKKINYGFLFVPFVFYVAFMGLVSSLAWDIPATVQFAYGEGRVWVQLVVFLSIVLSSRNFSLSMSDFRGPVLMWKALIIVGVVHGCAFMYQYVATSFGLPMIGISRAHGLTFEGGAADVAAFAVGNLNILRPGGLAGEPKTAAVLFGIVMIVQIIAGQPSAITKRWLVLSKISLILSTLCFLGAFSTSAYVGLAVSFFSLSVLGLITFRYSKYFIFAIALSLFFNYALIHLGFPSLTELFYMRFFDRIVGGEMDPPVDAAIKLFMNDIKIFTFGTGIGGGTFYIQKVLNTPFEYSLTPNIGAIAMLFEFGFLGTILLLLPFSMLLIKARRMTPGIGFVGGWELRFLQTLGITAMAFMLTGSGIALGYPMAIGSILGANNFQRPIAC